MKSNLKNISKMVDEHYNQMSASKKFLAKHHPYDVEITDRVVYEAKEHPTEQNKKLAEALKAYNTIGVDEKTKSKALEEYMKAFGIKR